VFTPLFLFVSFYSISMYLHEILVGLVVRGSSSLPQDVVRVLENARRRERNGIAKAQLSLILRNAELARTKRIPICQDTGVPVFYVRVGRRCNHVFDIEGELGKAVRTCTRNGLLRPNIVDPLSRKNSGDNVGRGIPIVHYGFFDGSHMEITYAPKGAGTENVGALWMLKPADGEGGIRRAVLEKVVEMGGRPCPPYVIGLGIGGTSERCMELAKLASIRSLRERNADCALARLERKLLVEVNKTGIGPMGLGGGTTCLGVNIEASDCHTATMPLAMAISCWADRRARVILRRQGHRWTD
jgi:fumarate hydratase subunit alpha